MNFYITIFPRQKASIQETLALSWLFEECESNCCVCLDTSFEEFFFIILSIPLECISFACLAKTTKTNHFSFMDCCTRIWFWWEEEEDLLAGGLAYLCELLTALVNYCQLCSHCTRYSVLSVAGVTTSVIHAYPVNSCRFCVRNPATTACYCKFLF